MGDYFIPSTHFYNIICTILKIHQVLKTETPKIRI